MPKKTISAHCIVRNDENFVGYAIESIVQYVDKVYIFDTGSNDKTELVIKELSNKYPDKVYFEQKGISDKIRHTCLRQEMLEMTRTDWFMILDGDEIWTKRGIEEAIELINSRDDVPWIVAPYYLCVGDIFHKYYKDWNQEYFGRPGFFTPRFIKRQEGMYWKGDYELDTLYYRDGSWVYGNKNLVFLKNKFWHLTHLIRSRQDDTTFTSGLDNVRTRKRRLTYFWIGRKINEAPPEVFLNTPYSRGITRMESFLNFLNLFMSRPGMTWRRLKRILKLGN